MGNIQNNMVLPVCASELVNTASLQGMQSLCEDVSGNTSELVNSSASSENIAEGKSENCSSDFEVAFHFEDFKSVGQDEECPIESTSTTDHTFIIEEGQSSHSVDMAKILTSYMNIWQKYRTLFTRNFCIVNKKQISMILQKRDHLRGLVLIILMSRRKVKTVTKILNLCIQERLLPLDLVLY